MSIGEVRKLKDFYNIKEFAALYGISTDALRYYEKQGLISPKRGSNSYRRYSLQDVYRLTIIRDMLEIGFSTAQIGEYLKSASLESSEKLLIEEQQVVTKQIAKIK